MIDKLPLLLTNELIGKKSSGSYCFQNNEKLWYGNIKIVTQPLSEFNIDKDCGYIKKSHVPLGLFFSDEGIIVNVDNESHLYDYKDLRKFTISSDTKYAQLWFQDKQDRYNDYVYDIEHSEELELIIKGICIFGKHFINIDKFNAWERKKFENTYF